MINFHKYGFLDVRKLRKYIENNHYWISRYNPYWLFVNAHKYRPEIAYDNDFCYIRFNMPNVGPCYYPPLGEGNILRGLRNIADDAGEKEIPLNFAPVDKEMAKTLTELNFEMKLNDSFESYIYSSFDLAYMKNLKKPLKAAKTFENNHKENELCYRKIKKEDFPNILEFVENWRTSQNIFDNVEFIEMLNVIKQLMDHLYEFEFHSIILYDENRIYGISIASIIDNMAYIHLHLALENEPGAYELLTMCMAKELAINVRYINFEEDLGKKELKERFEELKPLAKESFYATFRL